MSIGEGVSSSRRRGLDLSRRIDKIISCFHYSYIGSEDVPTEAFAEQEGVYNMGILRVA